LAMIGLMFQGFTLIGRIRPWAICCIVTGALLFLLFWDLDNWMMIGVLLMVTGFVPVRRILLEGEPRGVAVAEHGSGD
ncbi:MAG: hypothetical protein JO065_10525, partial [Acidobacteria bacterium]|nr:hypothetical protein [Acidobacteriota bacterium]